MRDTCLAAEARLSKEVGNFVGIAIARGFPLRMRLMTASKRLVHSLPNLDQLVHALSH